MVDDSDGNNGAVYFSVMRGATSYYYEWQSDGWVCVWRPSGFVLMPEINIIEVKHFGGGFECDGLSANCKTKLVITEGNLSV